MKKIKASGRSMWASYLVNGDVTDLTDEELSDMQAWLAFQGVEASECTGALDDPHYGQFDVGLRDVEPGELVTYTFLVSKADWRSRQM